MIDGQVAVISAVNNIVLIDCSLNLYYLKVISYITERLRDIYVGIHKLII